MRSSAGKRWLVVAGGFLGLASLGFFFGRATAKPPVPPPGNPANVTAEPPPAPPPPEPSADYSKRVVAYIFGSVPITREELGEYLIARFGADRLNNFVNKRVIEHAARQKGIACTAAEIEAGLEEDLRGINVNRKEFVERVLKHYNKTLYEWKEDVIRPRILMTKMSRDRVQVTEEDLLKAYEAYYGEKVDCRIIIFPHGEKNKVMNDIYGKIRDNEEEFERYATQQASPQLAAAGGHIRPIGRYTTGNEEMEKAAFGLRPGDISRVLDTKEGLLVIKCLTRIPPDKAKALAEVRADLQKEVFDKKVQAEIPVVFQEMRQLANVKLILKAYTTEDELLQEVREELKAEKQK